MDCLRFPMDLGGCLVRGFPVCRRNIFCWKSMHLFGERHMYVAQDSVFPKDIMNNMICLRRILYVSEEKRQGMFFEKKRFCGELFLS